MGREKVQSIMQIRVCSTDAGQDFDAAGYAKSLIGRAGKTSEARIGYQFLARHNISLVYYSLKHPKNKHHTNCYTPMQGGDADITTQNQAFDTIYHSSSNLTQAPPIGQYDASFISLYKSGSARSSPDLFDFVKDIPADVIAIIGALLFLLIMISCMDFACRLDHSLKFKQKIRISWWYFLKLAWKIMASTLGNWLPLSLLIRRKIFVILLISLIVTIRIMCILSMRTEQIVSLPSRRLDSIDQLLEYKVPFAYRIKEDYAVFKTSKSANIAKILSFSEDKYIYSNSMKVRGKMSLIKELMAQKQVYVIQSSTDHVRLTCLLARKNTIDLTGYGIDKVQLEGVPHPLAGNIMSSNFVKKFPEAAKLVQKSIRISIEADIVRSHGIRTKSAGVKDITRKCNLATGKSAPLLFHPSFRNMDRLILICFILMICALLLFIGENSVRLRASRKLMISVRKHSPLFLKPKETRACRLHICTIDHDVQPNVNETRNTEKYAKQIHMSRT